MNMQQPETELVPAISINELCCKLHTAILHVLDGERLEELIEPSEKEVDGQFTEIFKQRIANFQSWGKITSLKNSLTVVSLANNVFSWIVSESDDFEAKKFLGFHTLHNGFTFLGLKKIAANQAPICFIIFWNGTKLQAYVPVNGNLFDTDNNEPYGEIAEDDLENACKRYPHIFRSVKDYQSAKETINHLLNEMHFTCDEQRALKTAIRAIDKHINNGQMAEIEFNLNELNTDYAAMLDEIKTKFIVQ